MHDNDGDDDEGYDDDDGNIMMMTMNMKRQSFMTRFHVGQTETFLYEHFTQLTISQ